MIMSKPQFDVVKKANDEHIARLRDGQQESPDCQVCQQIGAAGPERKRSVARLRSTP